jgi:predicted outer membrane repeat protein
MRHICTSIVAMLVLAGTSFAATINVPGDHATIQAAIDAASDGDEVLVMPGIYQSGQSGHVVNLYGNITLRAVEGPEVTIIDGAHVRRCIARYQGNSHPTIIGFNLRNGGSPHFPYTGPTDWHDGWGAAIYCVYGGVTVRDCIIENNSCFDGGNSAEHYGAGLCFRWSTTAIVERCIFLSNIAEYGGAIYHPAVDLTVTDCVFASNVATGDGGAIYCLNTWTELDIGGTYFCDNTPQHIVAGYGGWTDVGGNEFHQWCDDDADGVFDYEDNCALYNPEQADCNSDGIGDICNISDGTSEDINSNDIPDECECLIDVVVDGEININDLLVVIGTWGTTGPMGDVNYDGIVDTNDILLVISAWGPCP